MSSVIARTPPIGGAIATLVAVGACGAIAWRGAVATSPVGNVWGVAFGVAAVALAARAVLRWSISRVTLTAGELVVRRPVRWRPHTAAIRVADIQALRFVSGSRAALVIEAKDREVVIPSGLFAVELRDIDAQIRAAAPHDRFPDPVAAVPILVRWAARGSIRGVAIGLGLLVGAIPIAIPMLGGPFGLMAIAPITMIAAIGLFGIAVLYRGSITLDARGVFFARGASTTFIAWPELDVDGLELKDGVVSKTLEMKAMKHGPNVKIALTRLLGMGFPVAAIYEALESAAVRHR